MVFGMRLNRIVRLSILSTGLLTGTLLALTALPINVMVEKDEAVNFIPLFKAVPVSAVTLAPAVVQPPAHGTLTLIPNKSYYWKQQRPLTPPWKRMAVTWFSYTPAAGFTGIDSFTYQMQDGSGGTSNTATCVLRVHPKEPGNMTVLIVATPAMLFALSAEINRLKTDLENEGYSSRITSFGGTDPKLLWDTLSTEYHRTDHTLAGTILIGSLPTGTSPVFDRGFWNMSLWMQNYFADSLWCALSDSVLERRDTMTVPFGASVTYSRSIMQIWASRFYAAGSVYGTEAQLIKRALDANHDFRTGASRYSHKAFLYDLNQSKTVTPATISSLCPEVHQDPFEGRIFLGPDTLKKDFTAYQPGSAGEIWHITSEMNRSDINPTFNSTFRWPKHVQDSTMRGPFQVRFSFFDGCQFGHLDGAAKAHLYTRGGGGVLAVAFNLYRIGPWSASYSQDKYRFCLATSAVPEAVLFRNHLAAGERVGRSWIKADIGLSSEYFYGDLSLKMKMAPSNQCPVVDTLKRVRPGGGKFRFSASARDLDGTITVYEWWFKPYNYGRTEPDTTTAVPVVEVDSLRCGSVVRLEVIDNYKARNYVNLSIGKDQILSGEEAVDGEGGAAVSLLPNPFNPSTSIRFSVMERGLVEVAVYSASGRLVRSLGRGLMNAGTHAIGWDGRDGEGGDVASGLFFVTIRSQNKTTQTKAILVR